MGLAEKRVLEEFKTIFNSKYLPELQKVGGLNLEIEVVWDEILGQMDKLDRMSIEGIDIYFTSVFIDPTKEALKSACSDKMGFDLISKSLKKVCFRCTGDQSGDRAFTFKDGLINIDHAFSCTDEYYTKGRSTYLTELVQNSL